MSKIYVFPTPVHNIENDGLLLRDYFAAKAMQGMLADSASVNEATGKRISLPDDEELVALASYSMADAMLAAREK